MQKLQDFEPVLAYFCTKFLAEFCRFDDENAIWDANNWEDFAQI